MNPKAKASGIKGDQNRLNKNKQKRTEQSKRQNNTEQQINPNNVIASSLHLLAENQKNLKCVVDKERGENVAAGKTTESFGQ